MLSCKRENNKREPNRERAQGTQVLGGKDQVCESLSEKQTGCFSEEMKDFASFLSHLELPLLFSTPSPLSSGVGSPGISV